MTPRVAPLYIYASPNARTGRPCFYRDNKRVMSGERDGNRQRETERQREGDRERETKTEKQKNRERNKDRDRERERDHEGMTKLIGVYGTRHEVRATSSHMLVEVKF